MTLRDSEGLTPSGPGEPSNPLSQPYQYADRDTEVQWKELNQEALPTHM